MLNQGWEQVYKEKGEVQVKILPKVERALDGFKDRGYRNVLDLGCGTGRHSIYMAKAGFSVQATDISGAGLEIAKTKAQALKLENIQFKQHDMRQIPYPEGSFDAVICVFAIDHGTRAQVKQTVDEIYRVLRIGGMIVTDFMSVQDETFGRGTRVEENTYLGSMESEEDIVHHYSTVEEIDEFFAPFTTKDIQQNDYRYLDDRGESYLIKSIDVVAVK